MTKFITRRGNGDIFGRTVITHLYVYVLLEHNRLRACLTCSLHEVTEHQPVCVLLQLPTKHLPLVQEELFLGLCRREGETNQ